VLELGLRSREQLLDLADMPVHRAADVEEQQDFHGVAAFRAQLHVEIAVLRRLADRGVEVKLFGGARAGEATQAAQRATRAEALVVEATRARDSAQAEARQAAAKAQAAEASDSVARGALNWCGRTRARPAAAGRRG
jgi:hypothetical protein